MTPPVDRFTLRQLPLAAKFVITTFLLTVGLGYFSAMIQLHMQHGNRDGNPLPTPDDVVEKFSGVKKFDGVFPTSKIETLISGHRAEGWGKNNMTPAFFGKSGSSYEKAIAKRGQKVVDEERETERLALIAWINAEPAARMQAYTDDKFPIPAALTGKPMTADFIDEDAKTVPIKTLIETRCLRCHDGSQKPDFDDYPKIEPLITAPKPEVIDGKWVRSSRQTSIEGLTQSTHAHLLSFAVLFTLTGLIFSYSSYWGVIRGLLAPMVLIAQVADISCWWLARLDGVGPLFALAILGTGAVVGLGLTLQIILSLFDLYEWKGKTVVLLILAAGLGGFGALYVSKIEPALKAEKARTP